MNTSSLEIEPTTYAPIRGILNLQLNLNLISLICLLSQLIDISVFTLLLCFYFYKFVESQ